jgi:hypothetical protein
MYRLAIGLSAVLVAAAAAFFIWGHDFLCVAEAQPPDRADLVVALAGPPSEDGLRVAAGAEMVRENLARLLLLPVRHRALDWPWFVRHYKIPEPIGAEQVIIGRREDNGRSVNASLGGTFAEAAKTVEVMRQHRLRSAVVVSSCYHLRRARLAFTRAARDRPELSFTFRAVERSGAGADLPWWRGGGFALRVADEYVKLIGGYLFYR